MIKWIRTSRLSIKHSLCTEGKVAVEVDVAVVDRELRELIRNALRAGLGFRV